MWIGRPNIFKISVLPNLIYKFNTIPARYFVDVNQMIHSLCRKAKYSESLSKHLKKKEKKTGRLALFDFKPKYKSTVIKNMWY